MKPYPWLTRKHFTAQRQFGHALSRLVWPLTVVGFLLNPVSLLPRFWATRRFHTKNDTWSRRGVILVAFGVLLILVLGAWPVPLGISVYDVLYSLGNKPDRLPVEEAVRTYLTMGLPWSLLLVGLAALCHSYNYEYSAQRYLMPTEVTLGMQMRRARNSKRLAAGAGSDDGYVKFGVIVDDVIPWRTIRYGRIVQRPVKQLGHGCITGTSGSGKTILAGNLAYWMAANDQAVIYVDCKASLTTLLAIKAVAEQVNAPFASFDVGLGSNERTWYDPLGWDGTPAQKTSMLVSSFDFPDTGAASYYRNAVEAWLSLQFEVMDAIGLNASESRFDFLHDTAHPARLRDRIGGWRSGSEYQRDKYAEWMRRSDGVKGDDLSNLRNNLARVINSAGDRLRPAPDGTPAVSLAEAAATGGIVYIGLSAATDVTALKVLGSLVLRDLTVLSGLRSNGQASMNRSILALVDEASRLGDRATVMEDLFATARESDVHVWPITQSFASWPTTTHDEIMMNASSQAAFRLQDPNTAADLSNHLGTIPALTEMTEQRIDHHAFRAETVSSDGGGRAQLDHVPHLRSDRLGSVEARYAYMWFTGSQSRATKERWRSRRVKKDVVSRDAPLVHVVPVNIVLPDDNTIGQQSMDPHNESFDFLTARFTGSHQIVQGEDGHEPQEHRPGLVTDEPHREPAPEREWGEDTYALDGDAAQPMTPAQRAYLQQQARPEPPAPGVEPDPESDAAPVTPPSPPRSVAPEPPKKPRKGGAYRTERLIDPEPDPTSPPVSPAPAFEPVAQEAPAGPPAPSEPPAQSAPVDAQPDGSEWDDEVLGVDPTPEQSVMEQEPVAPEPNNIAPSVAPESQQEPHAGFDLPIFDATAPPSQEAFPAPEQPTTGTEGGAGAMGDDEFDDPGEDAPGFTKAPTVESPTRPVLVEFERQQREEPVEDKPRRSGIFDYDDDDGEG